MACAGGAAYLAAGVSGEAEGVPRDEDTRPAPHRGSRARVRVDEEADGGYLRLAWTP